VASAVAVAAPSPSFAMIADHTRGGGVIGAAPSASSATRISQPRTAAATAPSTFATCARRNRARAGSVPSAYSAASASRRSSRSGRDRFIEFV